MYAQLNKQSTLGVASDQTSIKHSQKEISCMSSQTRHSAPAECSLPSSEKEPLYHEIICLGYLSLLHNMHTSLVETALAFRLANRQNIHLLCLHEELRDGLL